MQRYVFFSTWPSLFLQLTIIAIQTADAQTAASGMMDDGKGRTRTPSAKRVSTARSPAAPYPRKAA